MSLNEHTDSSPSAANSAASQRPDATATCSTSNGNFFSASKKSNQKTKVNLDHLIKEQTMISASLLERAKSVSVASKDRIDDGDWNFCMFMYNHMKSLSDEKSKFMLQMQIQNLMLQAKYGILSSNFLAHDSFAAANSFEYRQNMPAQGMGEQPQRFSVVPLGGWSNQQCQQQSTGALAHQFSAPTNATEPEGNRSMQNQPYQWQHAKESQSVGTWSTSRPDAGSWTNQHASASTAFFQQQPPQNTNWSSKPTDVAYGVQSQYNQNNLNPSIETGFVLEQQAQQRPVYSTSLPIQQQQLPSQWSGQQSTAESRRTASHNETASPVVWSIAASTSAVSSQPITERSSCLSLDFSAPEEIRTGDLDGKLTVL
jgi:hypothetical protein